MSRSIFRSACLVNWTNHSLPALFSLTLLSASGDERLQTLKTEVSVTSSFTRVLSHQRRDWEITNAAKSPNSGSDVSRRLVSRLAVIFNPGKYIPKAINRYIRVLLWLCKGGAGQYSVESVHRHLTGRLHLGIRLLTTPTPEHQSHVKCTPAT